MYNYILGIIYILFGLLKFIICSIMLLFKDDSIIKKHETLRYFTINDFTLTSKIYFFIMLIFSIDIFLKGFSKFDLIPKNYFSDYLYLFLGTITIIIYIFIVFYPKKSKFIERNNKYNDIYKSIYLNTGYIYIIMFLIEKIKKNKYNYIFNIVFMLLILINIYIMIKLDFIKILVDTGRELDVFIMIPLSVF